MSEIFTCIHQSNPSVLDIASYVGVFVCLGSFVVIFCLLRLWVRDLSYVWIEMRSFLDHQRGGGSDAGKWKFTESPGDRYDANSRDLT